MPTLDIYLLLSLGLFALGVAGVLMRRNALFVLMSIELMLNGATVALVAFSRHHTGSMPIEHAMSGQVMVLMIIAVAAAQAAVGIALVVALFRQTRGNIDVDSLGELKG